MISLRGATHADLAALLPRTRALQDHEAIEISDERLAAALEKLIGDASLGAVWLVDKDGAAVGYAIVTFGFDLEFGGRDAWLTELWIDEHARAGGTGALVLDLVAAELAARGVAAVHLQVRPENPAMRLYLRRGFVASPRTIMTRRLA